MANKVQYPYLAYSELTNQVYIVLNRDKQVNVTSQYEFIMREREKNNGEVLFKAKRIDNDEFVLGYYCKYGHIGKEKHYIIPYYASALYTIEIDPETIKQWNGNEDQENE